MEILHAALISGVLLILTVFLIVIFMRENKEKKNLFKSNKNLSVRNDFLDSTNSSLLSTIESLKKEMKEINEQNVELEAKLKALTTPQQEDKKPVAPTRKSTTKRSRTSK